MEYLIRHELLRHESVRLFSFMNYKYLNFDEKSKITRLGFYFEPTITCYICFSCHQIITAKYKDPKTIHQIHSKSSSYCRFLLGLDVSFGLNKNSKDINSFIVLGRSEYNFTDYFYREIDLSNELIERNYGNPEVLNRPRCQDLSCDCATNNFCRFRRSPVIRFKMGNLFLPMRVPEVKDSRRFFDIEIYFVSLRLKERRLETFNNEKHPFPYDQNFANQLASDGFFYTYLDTRIQCAFCRIAVYVHPEVIYLTPHKYLSPNCKFVSENISFNVPLSNKTITSVPTNIFELQCKICITNEVNCAYNCGHTFCYECSKELSVCPLCSKSLLGLRRIYLC